MNERNTVLPDKFGLWEPLLKMIDTHPDEQRREYMRHLVSHLREVYEPGFELPGKAFYLEPAPCPPALVEPDCFCAASSIRHKRGPGCYHAWST